MRKILNFFIIIWIAGFFSFMVYDHKLHDPEAKRIMESLKDEAVSVAPPPGASDSFWSATHKSHQALVTSNYATNMSYRELRTYYDRALAAHGWRLIREESIHDWGRDLGGVEADYQKGAYTASLQFAGPKANYGWTYAISFSWGIHL
jgi:hypothetical protein